MSELTLLVLQLGFLALLWCFVFAVVFALRTDLFGARVRKLQDEARSNHQPPVAVTAPTARKRGRDEGPATRLVITSGPREGQEIVLGAEPLTIGRSAESGLVIRDDYTSTHHARLMLWNDEWVIQDLDSTNGTFLDGTRVTLPTPVRPGSTVTIGTTSFELRR